MPGKRLYRVQTNGRGLLRMRLPGGRYEVWGISEGYDCEYPLEMHVRPFSKFKLNARLALRQVGHDGPEALPADTAEAQYAAEASPQYQYHDKRAAPPAPAELPAQE